MLHSTSRIAPISSATTLSRKASQSSNPKSKTNKRRVFKQKQQHKSYHSVQTSLQQNNDTSYDNNSNRHFDATEPSTIVTPSSSSSNAIANTSLTTTSLSSSTTTASETPGLIRIQTDTPTENVQVAVRCRPLSPMESDHAWQIDTSEAKIQLTEAAATNRRPPQQHHIQRQQKSCTTKEYYFDNVAYGSDNNSLYQTSVKPLIGQAMDGYNATVFAYGQTASGKTYTMMGTESEPGIIPRAVDEIFSYIKADTNNEFLLRVSYLEIYNETIRDLLEPLNDNLKIHENKQRGIHVTPMKEEVVTCSQDVLNVIQHGEGNRHISTTDYNLHSSRSHTIFQMVIESRQRSRDNSSTTTSRTSRTLLNTKGAKESVKISQLNLIDLAGSEKAASDQDRRKEGAYINKSLLTLGTVISKLTESGKRTGHIPYRDSKLTRILQPSLSGHAKVVVICTISPHLVAVDESINTLKFATRVKKIVLTARNDAVMDDKALLQQYRGEIMDLKQKLQTANEVFLKEKESNESMITAERQQYEQEMFKMRLVRSALKKRLDHLTKMILNSTSVTLPPANNDNIAINTIDEPIIDSNMLRQYQSPEQLTQQLSDMEIINSITTATTNPTATTTVSSNPRMTPGDSSNNPWVLVRMLRHEIKELRQNNDELQEQLNISNKRLKRLWNKDNRGNTPDLRSKVADLEAELSITKAELEITTHNGDDDYDHDDYDEDDIFTLGSTEYSVYV